jgi:hypothetical protein
MATVTDLSSEFDEEGRYRKLWRRCSKQSRPFRHG